MSFSKLLFLIFISFLFVVPADATQGKYAILIFGGYGGQESQDERVYVRAEMAYLFETLIEQCDYENDNIYVFNLGGEKNSSSHYDLFTDSTGINEVEHYFDAEFSTFQSQCNILNDSLNANSQNLLTVFICGHQSREPNGTNNTRQWYKFKDDVYSDSAFAEAIKDDLLEELHDVNSKTHVVFVTGFCASYGFYNDSPDYVELYDVVDYISYTAADVQNTGSAIYAGPERSFMNFWVDEIYNDPDISFDMAFENAEDTLFALYDWDDPEEAEDDPIKANPGGWDSDWNINGILPPSKPTNLSVAGHSNPRAALSWSDNSSNESGFEIYRSVNSGDFTFKASVGANVTSYNDYSISANNTYDYKVRAKRTHSSWTSYSDFSNEDDLPLICWITGPTSLEYKQSGTWDAYRAGKSGTPSYLWEKSFNQSTWNTIGTGSSVSQRMGAQTFYLRLTVTVGGTEAKDSVTVYYGEPKPIAGSEKMLKPIKYKLFPNYPNPFNPVTKIKFSIPEDTQVRIDICNIQGQSVTTLINRNMSAGFHEISFNANGLPSGIYFYTLTTEKYSDIKRMVLLK